MKISEKLPITGGGEIDNEELEERGYPFRHRQQLSDMYGPGLKEAEKHLSLALKDDTLIVLTGDYGVGKTQIATWWAAQRVLHNKNAGVYIKHFALLCFIKRARDIDALIVRYTRSPFLIIDDFGEKGASEEDMRASIDVICSRCDAMKCTVLIPSARQSNIERSILYRANQTGGVIYCDWPSYRS